MHCSLQTPNLEGPVPSAVTFLGRTYYCWPENIPAPQLQVQNFQQGQNAIPSPHISHQHCNTQHVLLPLPVTPTQNGCNQCRQCQCQQQRPTTVQPMTTPNTHQCLPAYQSRRHLFSSSSPCTCASPVVCSPAGHRPMPSPLAHPLYFAQSPDCTNVSSTVRTPIQSPSLDSLQSYPGMGSRFTRPSPIRPSSSSSSGCGTPMRSDSDFKDPNEYLPSALQKIPVVASREVSASKAADNVGSVGNPHFQKRIGIEENLPQENAALEEVMAEEPVKTEVFSPETVATRRPLPGVEKQSFCRVPEGNSAPESPHCPDPLDGSQQSNSPIAATAQPQKVKPPSTGDSAATSTQEVLPVASKESSRVSVIDLFSDSDDMGMEIKVTLGKRKYQSFDTSDSDFDGDLVKSKVPTTSADQLPKPDSTSKASKPNSSEKKANSSSDARPINHVSSRPEVDKEFRKVDVLSSSSFQMTSIFKCKPNGKVSIRKAPVKEESPSPPIDEQEPVWTDPPKKRTSDRNQRSSMLSSGEADISEDKEPITLSGWYFLVNTVCMRVAGIMRNPDGSGSAWNSGPVVEVIHPRCLVTKSSSVYLLEGKMDFYAAVAKGAPVSFANCFKNGFPNNWKSLFEEKRARKTMMDNTSSTPSSGAMVKPVRSVSRVRKEVNDAAAFTYPPKARPSRGRGRPRKHDDSISSLVKTEHRTRSSFSKSNLPTPSKSSPHFEFKRSSHGRIIKPRGMSFEYDFHGNIIEMPSPSKHFSKALAKSIKVKNSPLKSVSLEDTGTDDASDLESTPTIVRALNFSSSLEGGADAELEESSRSHRNKKARLLLIDNPKATPHADVDRNSPVDTFEEQEENKDGENGEEEEEEEEIEVEEEEIEEEEEKIEEEQEDVIPYQGSNSVATRTELYSKGPPTHCAHAVTVKEKAPMRSSTLVNRNRKRRPSSQCGKPKRRVRFSAVHEYGPRGTFTYSIGAATSTSSSSMSDSSATNSDELAHMSGPQGHRKRTSEQQTQYDGSSLKSLTDDQLLKVAKAGFNKSRQRSMDENTPLKRGRGRPPNNMKDSHLSVSGLSEDESFVSSGQSLRKTERQQDTVGKRGRGQPPKNKKLDSHLWDSDSSGDESTKTKKILFRDQHGRFISGDTLGSLDTDGNSYQTAQAVRNQSHLARSKKPTGSNSRQKLTLPDQEVYDLSDGEENPKAREWDAIARSKLFKIVSLVPVGIHTFWMEVAMRMRDGYSAQECQEEYQRTAKGLPRQQQKTKTKTHTYTALNNLASKGTLKRKTQVRDMVQLLDEGHKDDAFNTTPLRQHRVHLPAISSDSECEQEGGDAPSMETPVHSIKRSINAPMQRTPKMSSVLDSPDLTQHSRSAADLTVMRLQKGPQKHKRNCPPPQAQQTRERPRSVKYSKADSQTIASLSAQQTKAQQRMDRDPDSDSMYSSSSTEEY